MKTVAIEELDAKTSRWLREARQHHQVIVTDQGKPMLAVVASSGTDSRKSGFANRRLLPEYKAFFGQLGRSPDSTRLISEDRDRRAE